MTKALAAPGEPGLHPPPRGRLAAGLELLGQDPDQLLAHVVVLQQLAQRVVDRRLGGGRLGSGSSRPPRIGRDATTSGGPAEHRGLTAPRPGPIVNGRSQQGGGMSREKLHTEVRRDQLTDATLAVVADHGLRGPERRRGGPPRGAHALGDLPALRQQGRHARRGARPPARAPARRHRRLEESTR